MARESAWIIVPAKLCRPAFRPTCRAEARPTAAASIRCQAADAMIKARLRLSQSAPGGLVREGSARAKNSLYVVSGQAFD